jgi:hypothetical protein
VLEQENEMAHGQGDSLVLHLDTLAETIGCIPALR